MNVQETNEIRELTATELDQVSGGETAMERLFPWLRDFMEAVEQYNRITHVLR